MLQRAGFILVNHRCTWDNVELRWSNPNRSIHGNKMMKGNLEGIMSHQKPILPWDMVDKHTKQEGGGYNYGLQRAVAAGLGGTRLQKVPSPP